MDKSIDSSSRVQGVKADIKLEKVSRKSSLPVKVPGHQEIHSDKAHHVVKGHNKKVAEAASHHINIEMLVKPIDLWETYPTINLVEIRHVHEIHQLKRDLTKHLARAGRNEPHFTEYDLSPFGLSKKVQIIGNVYVPIKRSEHLDIQSTLLRASPELGIRNSQAITFIIVEDEIWDEVIPALQLHSATILALPEVRAEKEVKKAEMAVNRAIPKSKSSQVEGFRVTNLTPKIKAQVVKLLLDTIAQEFNSKEKAEKKRERELLKEEKCIKFAIEQFERLQKLVMTESKKRELSSHDFESIVKKWEDSCPPFPIRTMRSSTLWRELKSKMIQGFTI
jgi:hypothetical protein